MTRRMMVALSMMLSVRRCMAAKAGLLEAVGGKLGLCVALYCCWPSLAACATKEADFLAILSKNGFSYVCFTYRGSGQTSSPGVQAEMIFRRCRTFLALDTSAEWSNPSKGFQHRGMIPVLGTASLGDAIEFTGGPGFDPRFGPERSNFFCPGGLHATQDPPMRPRAARPPDTLECACGPSRRHKATTRNPGARLLQRRTTRAWRRIKNTRPPKN